MLIRGKRTVKLVIGVTSLSIISCSPMPSDSPRFLSYDATLGGDNLNPPVETNATATASITLDTDFGVASWTVSYSGLSGPVTDASFRIGEPGTAGVLLELATEDFADDSGFAQGAIGLSESEQDELADGNLLLVLATEANPDGEIGANFVD